MQRSKEVKTKVLRVIVTSLLLCFLASSAQAQFTGFSVPQPVSTIPFPAGTACTGSPQVALVPNLGQTEHFLTISTSSVLAFRATVQGSHDGVTFNDISDVATTNNGTVIGQGYYPVVQVSVTCATAAGTFGVRYSGEATAPGIQVGAQQSAQLDKTFAAGVAANANFTSQTLRAPFGTSGGGIYFAYAATGPAGSILNVGCSTLSIAAAASVASFPLATSTATQFFTVPLLPCDFITLQYTSGGASATTFTASYVFNNQTITGGDPCQGATAPKTGIAISATATTKLASGLSGHSFFVCGFNFTLAGGAAPVAVTQFNDGTGTLCGTGTVSHTGVMAAPASGTIAIDSGGGGYTIFKTTPSADLCLALAGTTPSAQGVVTVIQQ